MELGALTHLDKPLSHRFFLATVMPNRENLFTSEHSGFYLKEDWTYCKRPKVSATIDNEKIKERFTKLKSVRAFLANQDASGKLINDKFFTCFAMADFQF